MKNKTLNIIFYLFSLTFISCNESVKGNWSDADKISFRSDMRSIEELNAMGEYKSEFIDCYLAKCEGNYSSYFFADIDYDGCEKLAEDCVEEILSNGSVKGNWSEVDIRQANIELESIKELELLGEYKTNWIQCYLNKCEDNYSSLYTANLDETGCMELAKECNGEIF